MNAWKILICHAPTHEGATWRDPSRGSDQGKDTLLYREVKG